MQPQNYANTDLSTRLSQVEHRLQVLEAENQQLRRAALAPGGGANRQALALPRTNLVSPTFLKRAFAVWGHFFVANLIITLAIAVIYGCIMIAIVGLLGASLGNW